MVLFDDDDDLEREEEEDSDHYMIVAALLSDIADMEENERTKKEKRRESVPGHIVVPRDIYGTNLRIIAQYFADPPIYNAKFFRRRYRMLRELFLRIVAEVEAHDDYFRQKRNACGVPGATALQKVVGSFRMLAYGVPVDSVDEIVSLAQSTMIDIFKKFVRAVVEIYGDQYLRAPNVEDTKRLIAMNSARGFHGMLGSIDCMHWRWKNCPTAWKGQYTGHVDGPTMILEAVASQYLWIWHSFFGLPGSLNGINVLQRSPLFQKLTSGTAPELEYVVNGNKYTMGYYLADGIYPSWSTFVKTISNPEGNKKKHFSTMQEAVRKDVERAFGVLQARFAMVRGPARWWDKETIWYIMTACVILHNMIIDDERGEDVDFEYDQDDTKVLTKADYERRDPLLLRKFLAIHRRIQSRHTHDQLRDDLVEHLWARHDAQ